MKWLRDERGWRRASMKPASTRRDSLHVAIQTPLCAWRHTLSCGCERRQATINNTTRRVEGVGDTHMGSKHRVRYAFAMMRRKPAGTCCRAYPILLRVCIAT